MAQTTRTFVAVAVPDPLGQKLTRLQGLLAPEVPGVRWAATSPFHLTLAFLGDVANTALNDVCRAVSAEVAPLPPFDLRLEGLGAFPNPSRPRIVWVGASGPGVEAIEALQKAVVRAVRAAGYPPDEDRFHPHVTLGRLKGGRGPGPDLTALARHYQTWSAGSFHVAEAAVFASTLTPDGPVYATLARAPLEGQNPGKDA